MDDIAKEEGKNMEEAEENKSLSHTHVHAQLEEGQEPNPNPVDSVELETQNSIHDIGVEELHNDIQGSADSVPTVFKTPEDANITNNSSNEPHASSESVNLVSNVDSGVHCESEVSVKIESEQNDGEKGEALRDDVDIKVNPTTELCGSAETDNLVSDGGSSQTAIPMEIEKEEDDVEEGKALKEGVSSKANPSNEPDISVETNNVACEMELDIPRDSEVAMEKLIDGVSKEANPSSEPHISAEIGKVVCKVKPDMPPQVATEKLINGVSSEAKPSNEPHISAEADNVVCKVEPAMSCYTEVAMDKLIDEVSSEANPSNETYISAETDGAVCEVEPDMPLVDSKVAMEKLIDGVSSETNPSNEPHISAGTDGAVCEVEPDIPLVDSKVAMEKLIDAVSSEANPSNEPHSSAKTDDVVCKVELDMPRDSEVATEKLIDRVSSEANPSNEPHISAETDDAVCEVEPDIPRHSKVASEKLIDGVSSEANHSNEPYISAETDNVVCKVEPDKMPRDSGVATEKLIDGLSSKANPSSEQHMSAETDNVVSKVEHNVPLNNEVEMETESDDDGERGGTPKGGVSSKTMLSLSTEINEHMLKPKFYVGRKVGMKRLDPKQSSLSGPGAAEDDESGTEEEQAAFMKEVENVYKERNLEFKAPKFYREELNLLKLWRAVIKLGGYEKVTSCKLWRQVGETFNPPKTCTTVSWTFRNFYEKALLEFEKHRLHGGELALPAEPTKIENRADGSQTLGSGRALRDAAARAMQGWHSQRLLGNGEVGDAIIKDKNSSTVPKSDKQLKSSGLLKRKKPSHVDSAIQVADMKAIKPRLDIMVFDIGRPADWVKVNVKRFVHVQSDPAGRLIISGQPKQLDNPWGVTPFKKVVSLPSRIDPQQTSAVVTLNGQLFVRVPFEQSDF
ncbi:AT-rich interactive domain-containing protein 3-like isoform X2 [Prunus dulcis]|uniref:AT-rich interactive domain-containing protein 3-like isoform X2 n=1 Tax=Prunus dulcis TaxID=3755 RepID=UPI0014826122|nr:AT-rich interactive domain-containing protein 3-like isoform X2 [Prunus dulcis]